ncbi:hypothetical protein ASE04_29020 [Rhizobium sp. Root708]|uniref:hypothetical protein n=1 Tax=Rhizobium sp. Root708 TaxID=1736592 RepID=UPI00070084AB|nr:hypothetical protein [Rhizobium sp. Root708]KRB56195.1 hypothetical protein ASE04_29020 [Rhizobium sp. Root708]
MPTNDTARIAFRVWAPIVLFAAVTIGGMIFIWSAKLAAWSTPVVTAVPLVLMATYFLASIAFAGFRLHNEQAGDNLYYMGFLFTLSSLGVSLYMFAGETSIETIVRNFGIAVTSTIAGVTLRILFNQMRRDPIDIERSARHELAEMTRRVRTEPDSSAREFSNYRRVSNQMLTEGFEEIGRQAEKNGEEIRKVIEAISKEAIIPIQEAATKLSSIIEDHNRSVTDQAAEATRKLTETTDKLSTIIDKFGVSVEGVGTRLGEIRKPEDVIRLELTPTVDAIKDMTDAHLRRMEEGIAETRSQTAKVDDALKPLTSIDSKLDRIAEALERQRETPAPTFSTVDVDTIDAVVSETAVADPTDGTSAGNTPALTPAGAVQKRRLFRW